MEHLNNRAGGRPQSLFIGGLSPETTIEDIERWASGLGCGYSIDFEAKKAWAFVHLDSGGAAEEVLDRAHYIKGRKIDCQIAVEKEDKASNTVVSKRRKVFVNKLPMSAQEGDLRKALSIHGELRNFYIVKGKTNNRTLCYAEYLNGNNAKKAIKLGITYSGRRYRVYKYRTLEELQRNYEIRLDRANEGSPESQSKHGIEAYSSIEDFDKLIRSRKEKQQEFALPHVKPTSANSMHHFLKPCSKAFFEAQASASTTYVCNNPLFRITTEGGNTNEYKRCELGGTIVYLKLRQLWAPSTVGREERTEMRTEFPKSYYSRLKQVDNDEHKHNF